MSKFLSYFIEMERVYIPPFPVQFSVCSASHVGHFVGADKIFLGLLLYCIFETVAIVNIQSDFCSPYLPSNEYIKLY
jgi:hypothetical protein